MNVAHDACYKCAAILFEVFFVFEGAQKMRKTNKFYSLEMYTIHYTQIHTFFNFFYSLKNKEFYIKIFHVCRLSHWLHREFFLTF
jgi:hypothetical protein